MKFSSRVEAVSESATLVLSAEAARMRAEGVDVVGLLEGEPNLAVPEPIRIATSEALRQGHTRYSSASGLPELKAAISRKLEEENALIVTPENILITNGAKQALYQTMQALVDPGDEVLIPSPCWVTFPEAVKLAGGVPVLVETDETHQLDMTALEAAVTPKTKAIILNTPNNPTGAVYSEATLRGVLALAGRHSLSIVSDEAYESLVYDDRSHVSIARLSAAAAVRTITIQTFSKSFAMTGFRVGYVTGPTDFVRAAARVQSHLTGNVCTFAQHGALAALQLGEAHRKAWRAAHQQRRDLAYNYASRLFPCVKPGGGLFLFVDARRYLRPDRPDSVSLTLQLLEKGGVAVVPGLAFGREGFLRISFSASEEVIREGFTRLQRALMAL